MNKNLSITLLVVGLLVIGIAGFAFWNMSQNTQTNQTNNQNQNQNNNQISTEAGAPIVKTDSSTVPYISTVVVKGTVSPNGAATTYWYEYGQTNELGSKSTTYLLGSGYTTIYTPGYITGLKSNTDYYFKLVAKNIFGTTEGTTYSFKTNTTPAPQAAAPLATTNDASDITKSTAILRGDINPKGNQTTFWFEYGLTSDLGQITSLQTSTNDNFSSPASASLSSLKDATKYYFRLNAQNQFGMANGEVKTFTTAKSTTATTPTITTTSATAVTDSSAKLNANINPNGIIGTYWFEYSKDADLSTRMITSTPELSLTNSTVIANGSTTISNLNKDTKYYFRVVAKNQYGTVKGNIESFTSKK